MATGLDVVRVARTWLCTPYHHQGRVKGAGVDCAGLLVGVAKELGLSDFDVTGYSGRPNGDSLTRVCQEQMTLITLEQLTPGDVLLFKFEAHAGHLGIFIGDNTLIHSYMPRRRVVEHSLDARWWSLVAGQYRLPGVV